MCYAHFPGSMSEDFKEGETTQLIFTCSKSTTETLEKRCEICSKLTIKTPERCHWRRSGVFIINSEHISHFFLVFLLLTLSKCYLGRRKLKFLDIFCRNYMKRSEFSFGLKFSKELE